MKTTNHGVALAWRDGKQAQSGNMSTDGTRIFSYGLLVGIRNQEGDVFTRNASSDLNGKNEGGRFYSMTTSSKHLPAVRSAGFELGATELSDAEFSARFDRIPHWN